MVGGPIGRVLGGIVGLSMISYGLGMVLRSADDSGDDSGGGDSGDSGGDSDDSEESE